MSIFKRIAKAVSSDTLKAGAMKAADLNPRLTAHHGIPPEVSAIAYDPIQGLVALGTLQGAVKIVGKPGVEMYLREGPATPIRFLQFVINESALISISEDGLLQLWDTEWRAERRARLVQQFAVNEGVTSVHYVAQSQFLYLGTASGRLRVYNIAGGHLSPYTVHMRDIERECPDSPLTVVALQPTDANEMLLGWECGLLLLWDVKGRKTIRRYGKQLHPGLNTASWSCDGKSFIVGYQNGDMFVWGRKGSAPEAKLWVDGEKETARNPVLSVHWSRSHKAPATLFVHGGNITDASLTLPPPVFILRLAKKGPHSTQMVQHAAGVKQIIVGYHTPWTCMDEEPSTLLLLDGDGLVFEYNPSDTSRPCQPLMPMPRVTCMQLVDNMPALFVNDIMRVALVPQSARCSFGGEFVQSKFQMLPNVLVTGHDDGIVRFWDVTSVSLKPLMMVRVVQLPITAVHMCAISRTLAVAVANGDVYHYVFCDHERTYTLQTVASDAASAPADVEDDASSPISPALEEQYRAGFQPVFRLRAHETVVRKVMIIATQHRLVAGDDAGAVSITNTFSHSVLRVYQSPTPCRVTQLSAALFPVKDHPNHLTIIAGFESGLVTGFTMLGADVPMLPQQTQAKQQREGAVLGLYPVTLTAVRAVLHDAEYQPIVAPIQLNEQDLDELVGPVQHQQEDVSAEQPQQHTPAHETELKQQPSQEKPHSPLPQKQEEQQQQQQQQQEQQQQEQHEKEQQQQQQQQHEKDQQHTESALEEAPVEVNIKEQPQDATAPVTAPAAATEAATEVTTEATTTPAAAEHKLEPPAATPPTSQPVSPTTQIIQTALSPLPPTGTTPVPSPRPSQELTTQKPGAGFPIPSGPEVPLDPYEPDVVSTQLVIVYANALTVFDTHDGVRRAKVDFKTPAISCEFLTYQGESCVLVVDESHHITAYSVFSFASLCSSEALTAARMEFNEKTLSHTCWGSDGRGFAITVFGELVRLSTFTEEDQLQLPGSLPKLFTERTMPARPQGGFLSSLFSSATPDDSIFAGGAPARRPPPPSSQHQQEAAELGLGTAAEGAQQQQQQQGSAGSVQQAAGSVAGQLNETMSALQKRGENLQRLDEKVADMAQMSKDFASLATALRKKQESSWF